METQDYEKQRLEFAKSHKWEHPENQISDQFDLLSAMFGEYTPLAVHPTAVIGKPAGGFGFVRREDGTLLQMPHAGNVVIEKDVQIGAYTCIDRAVVGSTVIGEGTKIDNLVHVGHGAKIGKHCLIVAGAVIGGSAEIGDRCFIGMNASIKNKVKIGNDVTIGAGAVILKDVPDGETWVGNPGRKLEKK